MSAKDGRQAKQRNGQLRWFTVFLGNLHERASKIIRPAINLSLWVVLIGYTCAARAATGTPGTDFFSFIGNLQSVSQTITNAYTGETVELNGTYNVNSEPYYDGLAGNDILNFTNFRDYLSIRSGTTQVVIRVEVFILGDSDDVLNLADTEFALTNALTLFGGEGDDVIWGNVNNDQFSGAGGNDIINGGPGNDFVFGDQGDDQFYFGYGSGSDTNDGGDGFDEIVFTGGIALSNLVIAPVNSNYLGYEITVGTLGDHIRSLDIEQLRFADDSVFDLRFPHIGTQPQDKTNQVGTTASFNVAAFGPGLLSYQWWKDGVVLSGETNDTFTISSVQTSNAGNYYLVVTNTFSLYGDDGGESYYPTNHYSVTSIVATLTVLGPPASQVTALPPEAGPVIAVSWSGQAVLTGLPPSHYNLFVSTNGVDFSAWLTNTTATNASYRGVPGQTNYFYSIAVDSLGQSEATPVSPDTQTTVPLTAPILALVADAIIDPGQLLTFTNVVSAGTPVGDYEFSLESVAPSGATVTATNGAFKWTPTCSQATTTNHITVRVRDTGQTNLTDTTTFTVRVKECVSPQLGRLILEAGSSGRVPVLLVTSVPLTNLTMQLTLPAGLLINPFLETIVPELCASSVQTLSSNLYQLNFATCPAQSLIGTQQVAWLYFTAVTNQSSGFMGLYLDNVSGQQPDGTPVANFAPQSGSVVVVAGEPLLEALPGTNSGVIVNLYSHVGRTNVLQTATNLSPPIVWTLWQQVVMSNLLHEFNLSAPAATNEALFFRAYRINE